MHWRLKKIKSYMSVFCVFIFILLLSLYLFPSLAVYKKQHDNMSVIPQGLNSHPPLSPSLNPDQVREEQKRTAYYLNQAHFGASEYEKAQQELQQFNRPLIGIVGQDSDPVSYREYQQKILGAVY